MAQITGRRVHAGELHQHHERTTFQHHSVASIPRWGDSPFASDVTRVAARDDSHIISRRQHREFQEVEDVRATLRAEASRSRVAAIDAAIEGVAGRAVMSPGEVIDVLLDLRARVACSEILTEA
jgi:hypothetical protein